MSRRLAALLIGAAAGVLVVAVAYFLFFSRPAPEAGPGAAAPARPGAAGDEAPERWTAELFFPTSAGLLAPERRELAGAGEAARAVEAAVSALLAGPEAPGLLPAFPPGLEVRRALVVEGIAFVDLGRSGGGPPPASGSEEELLRLQALVHTVTASVPEARQVVLLWDGEQRPSLSGHVDTGSPLLPDPRLLAPAP